MVITVAHSTVDGNVVYGTIYKDTANVVRGHDYNFSISAIFNGDGIGHLTVVRDGVTLVDYSGQLGWAGMGDVYWKEGIYRSLAPETLAATFTSLDINAATTTAPPVSPGSVATPIVSFQQTLLDDTGASATDYVTSNGNYTLGGSATAGSLIVIQDGTTVLGTTTADGYGAWTFGGKLGEGAHNLVALATLGGITHNSATAAPIVVDLTSPTKAALSGFSAGGALLGELGVVNSGGLKISGTAEANNIVKVYIDGNLIGQTTANSNGAWTYDNSSNTLSDGTHWLQANALDLAGNSGGWSNVMHAVVFTTAPTAQFTSTLNSDLGASATDNITSYGKVTLTGTSTAGATIKIMDGATVFGTVTVGGSGAWAYTGMLSEGVHQLRADATLNGLTGSATDTRVITIDTTAPDKAQIGSLVPQGVNQSGQVYTNTGKISYTGVAEAGAKVTVQVDGKTVGDTIADAQGKWSYDATGTTLTDGAHWAIAVATDTAGNQGAWADPFKFNVTTVAPAVQFTSTLNSDLGASATDNITSYGKVTLTGTSAAGSTIKIMDGATVFGTVTVGDSGGWAYTGMLSEGVHQLRADATLNGLTGSATDTRVITIDTTAPDKAQIGSLVPQGVNPSGQVYTNTGKISYTGTAEAGAKVTVQVDGKTVGDTIADAQGKWSYDATGTTLTDGAHWAIAVATDTAGNQGAWADPFKFNVTTVAPAVQFTSTLNSDLGASATDNVTSYGKVTLTGTSAAGSTIKIMDGATVFGTVTVGDSGGWAYTGMLSEGVHQLRADATLNGLTGSATDTRVITIDTTAPDKAQIGSLVPQGVNPSGQVYTNTGKISYTGVAEAGAKVTVQVDGKTVGDTIADAQGKWSYDATGTTLTDGAHWAIAVATDTAGNQGAWADPFKFNVTTVAPAVQFTSTLNSDLGASATDNVTSYGKVTLTGTSAAGSTIKIMDGATVFGTVTVGDSGGWAYTGMLSEGVHQLRADATLNGLTGSATDTRVITIDTTAPDKAQVSALASQGVNPSGQVYTNTGKISYTGVAEAGAKVTVQVDGKTVGDTIADAQGKWSYDATGTTLTDGAHWAIAVATDTAGNQGAWADPFTFNVTTVAPTVQFTSTLNSDLGASATDNITSYGKVTLTGTSAAGSTIKIMDGATVFGTVTVGDSGAWAYTGMLSEGAHQLRADATLNGLTGSATDTRVITIDTTAPDKAQVSALASQGVNPSGQVYTNTGKISYTGVAEAGAKVTVQVDGKTVGDTIADAQGKWSYDATGTTLTDGAHWAIAVATDTAGNQGAWADPFKFNVTTVAPAVQFTSTLNSDLGASATDNITSYGKVTLTGTSAAGSTIKIMDGATVFGTVTVGDSGAWAYTGMLSEGAHQLRADATLNGLTGSATDTRVITIDTTAPDKAQVSALASQGVNPSGQVYTNTGKISYTGVAEAGAKVTVQVDGKTVGDTIADAQGKWSYDATGTTLTDGAHWAIAVATDTAGNQGAWADPFKFNVTTVAPTVQFTSTLNSDLGASATDNITSYGKVTLTGTSAAGSTIKIMDGATVFGTVTVGDSGGWAYTGMLSEGAHQLRADATLNGLTGSATDTRVITIDTTAPDKAQVSALASQGVNPSGQVYTNTGKISYTGVAEAGAKVTVQVDGKTVGDTIADAQGKWSYDATGTTLTDGAHWAIAVATDTAGNQGAWADPFTFNVTTVAPAVQFTSTLNSDLGASATDNITSYGKVTLAGTATVGSTVKIMDGATVFGTVTVGGSGAWAYTGMLSEGAHQLRADATLNGLTGSATDTRVITIDTTAPGQAQIGSVVPQVVNASGQVFTSTGKISYTGVAEAGAKVTVQVDGKTVGNVMADAQGKWSYDATGTTLADGAHWAIAVATDTAGNQGAWANTFTFTVDTIAPTLTFSNAGQNATAFTPYGKAEPNGQVIIQEANQTLQTLTVSSGGWWSANLTTSQTVAHTYYVTAFDQAGNSSSSYKLLAGTAAADVISSTKAGDVIFTGYGKDTVVLDVTTADRTSIIDFQLGQDKIRFTGFDASASVLQVDSTRWTVSDATHSATITLINGVALTASDYTFV